MGEGGFTPPGHCPAHANGVEPPSPGWPRNEHNLGFDPTTGPNRIAVVATTQTKSKRSSP